MTGLQDEEKALFERMVNDAMRVFGYGRPKAEKLVKGVIPRIRRQAKIQEERQKKATRKKKVNGSQKQNGPMTRQAIAKLPPIVPQRPPPRNAKERMERALGPDDGARRRGGSPVVQGGSPGLGRRR
ncbi:hypothetical protein RY963_000954 [Stenotrophomonas maltophilia]|nr:hypothetical protein [Stenotrophomonas maltophilia]ELN2592127.1 hypothetical protein [Stenotrophomonas maltophilia]MBH1400001.1 hypothetical protein [Stenotrophomonas maltophilia]